MQKILVVIDGLKMNPGTLDFSCYIGHLTRSKITGVFLENMVIENTPVLNYANDTTYFELELDVTSPQYKEKMKLIEQNISLFRETCVKRDVDCDVHRDSGVPAAEVIGESRFADLLIIGAETSFNRKYEGSPTEFVKGILTQAECPVIISPESFEKIDKIIFCYDGSSSALFAIKQFDYLLPELRGKTITLIEVNTTNEMSVAEKEKIKEWLLRHHADVEFEILHGEVKDELFSYLILKKNAFVVMGAYGRSMLSRLFKKSTAESVLKTTNLPVFIAHH